MSSTQAEAILFGLALGDALGYPTEFLRLSDLPGRPGIRSKYGPQGIQEPPTPALYTDDTQMSIALAEGLIDAGLHADLDTQMNAIGHRFVQWWHSPENNRSPGRTCMRAVAMFANGFSWRDSGIAHSKGCGSAMRVGTIGYFYQHDESRLRQVAESSGIITHGHPAAVAASIAAAYLVKLALDGVHPREYLSCVQAFAGGISQDFDRVMLHVGQALTLDNEDQALRLIGEGWVGDEAVGLALYCVMRSPDDYVAGVRRGANTDGDSDSIACIAGGILGARLGLEAIPQAWRERCEHRDELIDLAVRMAKARDHVVAG